MARILRSTTKLINNLEGAGRRSQETKVAKAAGEENLTKAPLKSKTPDNAGQEDPTEPRAPVEEYTVTKVWTEMSTKIEIHNVSEMKQISRPSSIALPKINCPPSSPLAIAGSFKPAELNSIEQTDVQSSLILAMLRAR